MSITITRSGAADRPAILQLVSEARGDDLSNEERAEQGFIQGNIDESLIARFQAGSGVFVARKGSDLVGFAMTSLPGAVSNGPPAFSITATRDALPEIPKAELFLYGPATVGRKYQGHGIMTQLLTHVCMEMRQQYKLGIAFVEQANKN